MISGLLARIRSLFHGARNEDLDVEMQAEFAHHIELRARDLVTMTSDVQSFPCERWHVHPRDAGDSTARDAR